MFTLCAFIDNRGVIESILVLHETEAKFLEEAAYLKNYSLFCETRKNLE